MDGGDKGPLKPRRVETIRASLGVIRPIWVPRHPLMGSEEPSNAGGVPRGLTSLEVRVSEQARHSLREEALGIAISCDVVYSECMHAYPHPRCARRPWSSLCFIMRFGIDFNLGA